MEGVGARLGRSSSRYGTTTVFSGPVRKWKKDWVPIPPSSSSSSSSPSNNSNHHHHHHLPSSSSSSLANGSSTNGSVSHIRIFKWTPVSQTTNKENSNINNNNGDTNDNTPNSDSPTKDSATEDAISQEPPRRKFKYIPIAVLEEKKRGAEENTDDEANPADTLENTAERGFKSDRYEEKPDINDVPMEENQDTEEENQTAPGRQDLNKSLDLSLG